MSRTQELEPVINVLRAYGEAVYDKKQTKLLNFMVKRIENLLNEFWVTPDEFRTMVKQITEENDGKFPSVLILEVVFPKVPIMEEPKANPLWN